MTKIVEQLKTEFTSAETLNRHLCTSTNDKRKKQLGNYINHKNLKFHLWKCTTVVAVRHDHMEIFM